MITRQDREKALKEIQDIIQEYSYEQLDKLSATIRQQEVQRIKTDISNYLSEYNAFKAMLTSTQMLESVNFQNENVQRYVTYKNWRSQHIDVKIDLILKKGYILIEKLREAFTGKTIEYVVGFEGSVSRGQRELVNKKMSLEEMLSYSYVDINWGATGENAFKLRASASARDFRNEYEEVKQRAEAALSMHTNSLYVIINKVITDQYQRTNLGNVYETYWHLRHEGYPDKSNDYSITSIPTNPDLDIIIEAYKKVRKGTQSFVTGGDLGDEQYKLLTKSPSIASMYTIELALKAIFQELSKAKSTKAALTKVKQNIFSQHFDTLSRQAAQDIIEDVDKQFLNTGFLTN